MSEKNPQRGAWRPAMPRKGKAILLDARESSSLYGWTEEAIAAIHAARDAGWTLEEIGEILGCTREFVRQLYERDVTPEVSIAGFPTKPKRPKAPKPVPMNILRRGLVSMEEIAELKEMQKVVKWRRQGGNPKTAAIAEDYWARINHIVSLGVSVHWLSSQMGLAHQTLRFGLARYGYLPLSPSQPQRRTGQVDS